MNRYTIVVRVLNVAAKTERMFCTASVLMEEGHPLFHNTIAYLIERFGLRETELGCEAGSTVMPCRTRLEGDGGKAVEVMLVPETVYDPSPFQIGERIIELSPFTFG